MAHARGGSRSRATRLSKVWTAIPIIAPTGLSGTQAVMGSLTLGETALQDATVLRCRGNLLITAVPDAATDSDTVGLGICVVTAAAIAVGGTSIPGPINDLGFDGWLWHQFVPLDAVSLTAADEQAITLNVRVEIDAKAMRRMPQDHGVVLMAESNTGLFSSVQVSGGMRILLGT